MDIEKFNIESAPFGESVRYIYTYDGMTDDQISEARETYISIHGQYNVDYNPTHYMAFIRDYAAANNILATIVHEGVQVSRMHPYYYTYTNLTYREEGIIERFANHFNNNIQVSPEALHAMVMAYAQYVSRDITSQRVYYNDRNIERRQTAAMTRRRRRRRQQARNNTLFRNRLNTTLARRRRSLPQSLSSRRRRSLPQSQSQYDL